LSVHIKIDFTDEEITAIDKAVNDYIDDYESLVERIKEILRLKQQDFRCEIGSCIDETDVPEGVVEGELEGKVGGVLKDKTETEGQQEQSTGVIVDHPNLQWWQDEQEIEFIRLHLKMIDIKTMEDIILELEIKLEYDEDNVINKLSLAYESLAEKELDKLLLNDINNLQYYPYELDKINYYYQTAIDYLERVIKISENKKIIEDMNNRLNQLKLKLIYLNPVQNDPILDKNKKSAKLDDIISRLRPTHFVESLSVLEQIIKSDALMSRKRTGKKISTDEMERGEEDQIFLSAGLPYLHLPSARISTSDSPLIIFNNNVYYEDGILRDDFRFTPRDSGGYKDKEDIDRHTFDDTKSLRNYLDVLISNQGIRKIEPNTILNAQKSIPITFFPEITLTDKIDLDKIEAILISRRDADELERKGIYQQLRNKVNIIVVPDGIDIANYYYIYTGLNQFLDMIS
ncbi:MAG: hypothetical protein ABIG89_05870, partial [Candidatus Woesearchaeota archaeon]